LESAHLGEHLFIEGDEDGGLGLRRGRGGGGFGADNCGGEQDEGRKGEDESHGEGANQPTLPSSPTPARRAGP